MNLVTYLLMHQLGWSILAIAALTVLLIWCNSDLPGAEEPKGPYQGGDFD